MLAYATQPDAATSVLYLRYHHLVRGVCLRRLSARSDADDVASRVWLKVLHALPVEVSNFQAWLLTVTVNECNSHYRKEMGEIKKIKKSENFLVEFVENETLDSLIEKDSHMESLHEGLRLLKSEQRRCVELFYFEKKTYQKISEETSFSLNEVKSHIQTARHNLKKYISKKQLTQQLNS